MFEGHVGLELASGAMLLASTANGEWALEKLRGFGSAVQAMLQEAGGAAAVGEEAIEALPLEEQLRLLQRLYDGHLVLPDVEDEFDEGWGFNEPKPLTDMEEQTDGAVAAAMAAAPAAADDADEADMEEAEGVHRGGRSLRSRTAKDAKQDETPSKRGARKTPAAKGGKKAKKAAEEEADSGERELTEKEKEEYEFCKVSSVRSPPPAIRFHCAASHRADDGRLRGPFSARRRSRRGCDRPPLNPCKCSRSRSGAPLRGWRRARGLSISTMSSCSRSSMPFARCCCAKASARCAAPGGGQRCAPCPL